MPLETIIVLTLIVAVFVTFGSALAYGEYQTRNLKRVPDAAPASEQDEQEWLKAA